MSFCLQRILGNRDKGLGEEVNSQPSDYGENFVLGCIVAATVNYGYTSTRKSRHFNEIWYGFRKMSVNSGAQFGRQHIFTHLQKLMIMLLLTKVKVPNRKRSTSRLYIVTLLI